MISLNTVDVNDRLGSPEVQYYWVCQQNIITDTMSISMFSEVKSP